MLPFMKLKQAPVAGIIIKRRESDPAPEGSLDAQNAEAAEDSDAGIETCAYALISAVHSQDTKAVAQALRDIFTILDSQPHEEGEHTNEEDKPSESTLNTFKYQNVKAAGKDNA